MAQKQNTTEFEFRPSVIGYPLFFVLAIWLVFWFEIRFGFDFNDFGIFPRTMVGLRGIVLSPFIHGDFSHLWNNTLPLLVLSTSLFYFYPKISWKVLVLGVLFSGFGTWLIGRPSNHIGASGLIYTLFGFLFLKGIIARHFRLIALSFLVVFLYGGMLWYIAPVDPKISWEGHLAGLLSGAVFAVLFRQGIYKQPKFQWEDASYDPDTDEFMQQFDANGNFSPLPVLPPEYLIEVQNPEIVYTIIPDSNSKIKDVAGNTNLFSGTEATESGDSERT